jgi:aminoglycoside phosphotransferase (APT) family kinase protein
MSDVRKEHQFPLPPLEKYLQERGFFQTPIASIKQFKSGQSNPTFYLKDSRGQEFVLRKKPPGKLLKSAHMVRICYDRLQNLYSICSPNSLDERIIDKINWIFCSEDVDLFGT